MITQITTLCDGADRIILLSAPQLYPGFSADDIRSFEEQEPSYVLNAAGKDWEIPYKNLKAYQSTNVMLAITVPGPLEEGIVAGEFSGGWALPAGMGPRMAFQASADADGQKAIAASFRHCYR